MNDAITRNVGGPAGVAVDVIQSRDEKFVRVLLRIASEFSRFPPGADQECDWTVGVGLVREYLDTLARRKDEKEKHQPP